VARAGRPLTDLEVLLEVFERGHLDEPAREWLFESLGLPIGWRLDGAGASRTQARLPWARPFFLGADGESPIRRPDRREFARELARPLRSLRRAPRPLAERVIESARLAMATRSRELFAFDHANPDDVLVADLGRGLRIALVGIVPDFRLAFEGYYAYLALENGVPVGYGAGWQLLDVLELAVNVFESFRRGESAFIVSQVLRVYRRAFGMRAVVVDPFQIGRDNPEALRSGAFYFYRHLGFRPRDPVVGRLADAEQDKIAGDPSYRSPLATLARLARSEIYLSLVQEEPAPDRLVTSSRLAALVTDRIASVFHGDRQAALRESASRVARVLGVSRRGSWPAGERRAFEQLSLLAALIPNLDRWSTAERRGLVEVLRAKGGPSEAHYVRLLARHRRLRSSLTHLITANASPGVKRGR
jgi:hypothetical protein